MNDDQRTAPLLRVALLGRCPRCGEGALFEGYLRVVEKCQVCGLGFAGHDSADGPAFFVMLPLSLITAMLALLLEVHAGPPLWAHALLWPAFIAAFAGLTLRPVKAAMVALQYRYRDVERDVPGGG
jgi:uncharacterized protein (DUF983 family)